MGTSLSGLTPATTFDGLLKTSDNDAITSSLKTIGSGDGTDSCLQLSDSALKVNSGAVTIVGTGATSATTSLLVQNSSGDDIVSVTDDGATTLKASGASNTLILDAPSGVSGFQMNSSNGQQRFRIQGTSTATRFTANNTNDAFTFVGNGIYTSGAFDIPSARLHVKGSGATSATTSLLVQNSAGSNALKVTDDKNIETYDATGNIIAKNNAGNRRFEINPDLNSLVDFQVSGGGLSNLIRTDSGLNAVGIGANGLANTRFYVKGSGATSATTSLLVQNSAGDDMLKVTDNGKVGIGGVASPSQSLHINGNIRVNDANGIIYSNKFAGLSAGDLSISTSGNTLLAQTGNVGIGEPAPTARFHLKGAGNTSADYALKILNSDDSTLFDIRNDSVIRIAPNSTNAVSFRNAKMQDGNAVFGTTTIPASTRMTIKGQGATSATTSLLVQNSAGSELFKLTDDGTINLGVPGDNPTIQSGSNAGKSLTLGSTATLSALNINLSTYNGINYTPVLSVTGNTDQRVGIGETTPTARLHVKGAGATSATTALLVENSSGTDTLEVRDDGQINFNGNIYANADYKSIGRNSLNSIRFAGGETRVSVQGTSSANKFHVYASSTATSVFSVFTQTQQVGIGNGSNSLDGTAKLQIDSTTQGFLPPRMTGTQIDAIESPASGLIIYNTTSNKAVCYNGTSWNDMF